MQTAKNTPCAVTRLYKKEYFAVFFQFLSLSNYIFFGHGTNKETGRMTEGCRLYYLTSAQLTVARLPLIFRQQIRKTVPAVRTDWHGM